MYETVTQGTEFEGRKECIAFTEKIGVGFGRMHVFCTPAINAVYALGSHPLSPSLSNTSAGITSLSSLTFIRRRLLHHQTRYTSRGCPSIGATQPSVHS